MNFGTHRVCIPVRDPGTYPVELVYPHLAYECRLSLAFNLFFGEFDTSKDCSAVCVAHLEYQAEDEFKPTERM
uniref:ZP domain-containing protein n=1 Tax=Steinernema glaseri TaxID=37863 RepID=A0A1I7YFF0_9BILA